MNARALSIAALLSLSGAEAGELFPDRGQVNATFATGIPYLAIGEVAYGFTDRFALGVIGGVTPITYGIGLRGRGIVYEGATLRLIAMAPILYYPATGSLGHEPWLLTLPNLLAEHSIGTCSAVRASLGVAAATTFGAIGDFVSGHSSSSSSSGWGAPPGSSSAPGGFWNTAGVGGSTCVGSYGLFADVTAILHGVRPASSDWIGGPPVVVTLGARRGF